MIATAVRAIIQYRYFVLSAIRAEFRARTARSRFGLVWIIAQPLAQVIIFSLILSQVMKGRLPGMENQHAYIIYLLAGIAAWSLFADTFSRSLTLFIDHAASLKKISFPKLTLPIVGAGIALINNLIFQALMFAGFAALGHWPGWSILWMPFLTLLCIALGLSLGLFFGILNVFIRDIGQGAQLALQFGFWLTPIVYHVDMVPGALRAVLPFNPVTAIVDAFHAALAYGVAPAWSSLAIVTGVVILFSSLTVALWRKASSELVDVL
jgi:lipopolysaccharide transport system permease protein